MTMGQQRDRSVREMVEAIMADGKLTRAELSQFDEVVLADGQLSAEERQWIAKLLGMISRGELQVVD